MASETTLLERDLIAALQPFADFYVRGAPDSHVITMGSRMAKRQLTMGDCRRAHELLKDVIESGVGTRS
ncbi:MAG: hypothetical protein ACK40O_00965 [Allosphingosinicella sp.]